MLVTVSNSRKKYLIVTKTTVLGNDMYITKAQFYSVYFSISVDPNLRNVVYCNALRYAKTPDNFYFLLDKYKETKLSTEQVTILATLGCTKNASLLTE